jgi:hypothetical protein
MMSVGDQEIRFDRDATLELYRTSITASGADACGCSYCRNFSQQRRTLYSDKFRQLLSRLGADENREWEVFELGPSTSSPRSRLYGGWFLFCGELLVKGSSLPLTPFSFAFSSSFPTGTLPTFQSICAVEFSAEIPWILQEPVD